VKRYRTKALFFALSLLLTFIGASLLPTNTTNSSVSAVGTCPSGYSSITKTTSFIASGTIAPNAKVTIDVNACAKAISDTQGNLKEVWVSVHNTGKPNACISTSIAIVFTHDGTNDADHLNGVDCNKTVSQSGDINKNYGLTKATLVVSTGIGQGFDPNTETIDSHRVAVDISNPSKNSNQGTQHGTDGIVSAGDTGGGDGTSTDTTPTCETGGFGLNWIICPVFNGVAAFCDWMFENIVQPFLRTSPVSTDAHDPSFRIWSQFRIYGNVLLVIGLLALVFGQSIGGGLIDAYTVKKSMPRILIAAILINLSIYIVAGLVDITNVVGGTLGGVITGPLSGAGAFHFTPSTVQAGSIIGATGAGAITAALAGLAGALVTVEVGKFILLFIVMPVALGLIAAFVTLILRKAIILALILVSPVAFALYCLPNTEKYFKKWWDFLVQTLLVYPIVIVIFAVADVLSVTVMNANGSSNVIAPMIAFVLQFLPLLMIPYAFRLAGGAVGLVHETLTNYHKRGQEAVKGNVNDPYSLRNMTRRGAGNAMLSGRERAVNRYVAQQKNGGRRGLRGAAIALGGRAAGFGNYQVRRSLRNKEGSELVQNQTNYGDDSTVRAAFARQLSYTDKNGARKTGYFGTGVLDDGQGNAIGQTSSQFSSFEVSKARQLNMRDPSLYQAALTYEVGKAGDDTELAQVMAAHHAAVQSNPQLQGFGGGIWKGAAFQHQQTRKELKHTSYNESTGEYTRDAPKFTREVAETVNSWSLGNMRTSTIKALRDDHRAADAVLDLRKAEMGDAVDPTRLAKARELEASGALDGFKSNVTNAQGQIIGTQLDNTSVAKAEQVRSDVAKTAAELDSRNRLGGGYGLAGEEGHETPISGGQTGAAGRVATEINGLIGDVRAAGGLPPVQQRGGPNRPAGANGGGN